MNTKLNSTPQKSILQKGSKEALTLRNDFPMYKSHPTLVYLDNTATSHKPKSVLKAMNDFYCLYNANVHRGVYSLAEKATIAFEQARDSVAHFIGADREEVIFTSGTTSGLNLAMRLLAPHIKKDDEIVVSVVEHHSNLVPWQELAKEKNAILRFIPITANYTLDLKAARTIINSKTKIVAITGISNVLGMETPLGDIIALAHKHGAKTIIDGAQMVAHGKVDVHTLNCDFFSFSGHKMFGPTGIGVLYGRKALLEKLKPHVFGGEMVREVNSYHAKWNELPWKFEAGTPMIAQAIGLRAAIEYIKHRKLYAKEEYLRVLRNYTIAELQKLGATIIGPQHGAPIITFTLAGIHPHDIAQILDRDEICIRAGHHCAMPLHQELKIQASARVSLSYYNTKEDIDRFLQGIKKVYAIFGVKHHE